MDPIAGSQLHSQVGGSILSSGCSRSGVFGVFSCSRGFHLGSPVLRGGVLEGYCGLEVSTLALHLRGGG